ncbi:MAG: M24 family metallopeptidase [Rhodospirillales bacterium]
MRSDLPIAERDRRIAALRAAMARSGLDALLIPGKGHMWTGRGAVRYLAEFHLWAHDALILLPAVGDPVMTVSSHGVASRVAARGWIEDVRGDFRLTRRMADAVRERRLERSRIGVARTGWVFPAGMLDALRAALPGVDFAPADRVFERVRSVKSPLEIEQARALWPVIRAAFASFGAALRPGITQQAAWAEAVRTATAMGVRDMMAFIGEAPDEYDPPADVPLRCDGVVRLHMEICGASGHWCERTVTFARRDPTPAERSVLEAEVRAYAAVRAAARPGATLAGISAVFAEAMADGGWAPTGPSAHYDFHGQGLDAIEWPLHSSADPAGTHGDAVLEAGQVFSYHPARPYGRTAGFLPDIHDNMLVTGTGGERLSGDWDLGWTPMG